MNKNNNDKTRVGEECTQIGEQEYGWLVVHDVNAKQQTFGLKLGDNIVGRKSDNKPCDVMVECRDMNMSRNHFNIHVKRGVKGYEYRVNDVTSTNGTFINSDLSKKLGQSDSIYLNDGDTIQAGETTMVIRTKQGGGTGETATGTVITNGQIPKV